jgi:hypothetical protein
VLGGNEQGAEHVAVQGGGVGLVVQPWPTDMHGRGVIKELFLDDFGAVASHRGRRCGVASSQQPCVLSCSADDAKAACDDDVVGVTEAVPPGQDGKIAKIYARYVESWAHFGASAARGRPLLPGHADSVVPTVRH